MPGKYLATPIKEAIVRAKLQGKTDRAVAALFQVSHQTVSGIFRKHQAESYPKFFQLSSLFSMQGDVHRRSKSGRPRKCSEWQDRALVREIKKDSKSSTTDVRSYAQQHFGLNISKWTAARILNRAKLFARRPASKPLLTQAHQKARLQFARAHKHWTSEDWGRVLWSDESKFNLMNPDGGQWVRRAPGTRYKDQHIKSTLKFGGGNVMAWG